MSENERAPCDINSVPDDAVHVYYDTKQQLVFASNVVKVIFATEINVLVVESPDFWGVSSQVLDFSPIVRKLVFKCAASSFSPESFPMSLTCSVVYCCDVDPVITKFFTN